MFYRKLFIYYTFLCSPLLSLGSYLQASEQGMKELLDILNNSSPKVDAFEEVLMKYDNINLNQEKNLTSKALKKSSNTSDLTIRPFFNLLLQYRPLDSSFALDLSNEKGNKLLKDGIEDFTRRQERRWYAQLLFSLLTYAPKNKKFQINLNNQSGYELLTYAIDCDSTKGVTPSNCLELLLDYGLLRSSYQLDINLKCKKTGNTLLHYACKKLVNQNMNTDEIEENILHLIEIIVKRGIDPEIKNNNSQSAIELSSAIIAKNPNNIFQDIDKKLLEKAEQKIKENKENIEAVKDIKAKIDAGDEDGLSELFKKNKKIDFSKTDILKKAIDKNIKILNLLLGYRPSSHLHRFNLNSYYGHNAIIYASEKNIDALKDMLSSKVDTSTNEQNHQEKKFTFNINEAELSTGKTLIHRLLEANNEDYLLRLLELLSDRKLEKVYLPLISFNRKSILRYLLEGEYVATLKKLLDLEYSIRVSESNLFYIIQTGKTKSLTTLLEHKNWDKFVELTVYEDTIKKVLAIDNSNQKRGQSIGPFLPKILAYCSNAKRKPYLNLYELLQYAIQLNYLKGVKSLLELRSGGNYTIIFDSKNDSGNNLLHEAMTQYDQIFSSKDTKQKDESKNKSTLIIEELIKSHTVSTGLKNQNGTTPIEILSEDAKKELALELKKTNLSQTLQDSILSGITRKSKWDELIKSIDMSRNSLTKENFSRFNELLKEEDYLKEEIQLDILKEAIESRVGNEITLQTVTLLLKKFPGIANQKQDNNWTPVYGCVQSNRADCLKVLRQYNIEPEEATKVLREASSKKNRASSIAVLREYPNINVNYFPESGSHSNLMLAMAFGDFETAKELLKFPKINVNYRSKSGINALQAAAENNTETSASQAVAELLKKDNVDLGRLDNDDKNNKSEYPLLLFARDPDTLNLIINHQNSNLKVTTREKKNTLLHQIAIAINGYEKYSPNDPVRKERAEKLKKMLPDLLKKGEIDPTLPNAEGKVASQLLKNPTIVAMLKKAEKEYTSQKKLPDDKKLPGHDKGIFSAIFSNPGKTTLFILLTVVGITLPALYFFLYKKKDTSKQ